MSIPRSPSNGLGGCYSGQSLNRVLVPIAALPPSDEALAHPSVQLTLG
jgi:hypothetical protein